MHIRTHLDAFLPHFSALSLLRLSSLAMPSPFRGQLRTRTPETTENRSVRLNHYLRAQEALAGVQGELSDDIIAMREDRI